MNTCQVCGKDNQGHYRFCAGCGAEIIASSAPPGGVVGDIDAHEEHLGVLVDQIHRQADKVLVMEDGCLLSD